MSYTFIERPPPFEGIWFCRACMLMRAFCTTPEHEGRDVPDAPLYCDECGWEMLFEIDIVQRYPEPPIVMKHHMPEAERRAGKERLRVFLLSISAPRTPRPEPGPVDMDAFAIQLAQLKAGARRTAA